MVGLPIPFCNGIGRIHAEPLFVTFFQDGDLGFCVVDSHVSDGANSSNSDILVLNERMFTLYVSPRGNLKIEDWQTPVDMDAITTKMLWAGNLVCKSPRTQAKLANITG